jgi:hypothetical protein
MKTTSRKTSLAVCLSLALLLAPLRAHAGLGDILSLLTTITGTLRNGIGQVLNGIHQAENGINLFEQQAIWPVTLIDQARTSVNQVHSEFSSLAAEVHGIEVSSAKLQNPGRLEALVRGTSSKDLNQLTSAYGQVYLALPEATEATDSQRNLIGADDVFALGAMKAAALSDQETGTVLGLAESLEKEAAVSAPGSAAMVTAEAQVASLESQAMLQKMLAQQLRQEAAALAHQNALRKHSASANKELRNNLLHILGRR